MWQELNGKVFQYAGTAAGTVTIDAGVALHQIIAHATTTNGTIVIFGGPTITVIAGAPPLVIQFMHTLVRATSAAATVVFGGAGLDSYFIHGVREGL
jgi:hypothetical protein